MIRRAYKTVQVLIMILLTGMMILLLPLGLIALPLYRELFKKELPRD